MIVVADTSPINYLAQIDSVQLLPDLYGEVIITPSVLRELSHPHAPPSVKRLLERWPKWLLLRSPSLIQPDLLSSLDQGEREAIQYAFESHADLIIIDERIGCAAAENRGLTTIGTLGILLQAGRLRLTDPVTAFLRLLSMTNFRISAAQKTDFMHKAASLTS